MTTYNKVTLKTFFAQGDIPQGSDYANLIDSQVNIAETGQQSMAGPLAATKLIAPLVSASNLNVPGSISGITGTFTSIVSAASINLSGDVSAATGSVYASAIRSANGNYSTPVIVSAVGTALATAAQLIAVINRVQGVVDGQTTGVKLLSGRLGFAPQFVINETAVSANLWPAGSDYKINGLASGAAFSMAANTPYTVIYSQNSAYSVK